MKYSITILAVLSLALGCGKKDADKSSDKPATTDQAAPVDKPTATDKPVRTDKPAVLPPECDEFMAALDKLMKCEKLADGRAQMKEGYDKMLKAMSDLNDPKASADGCKAGMAGLKQALTTAGC
jgi:hypothetical protein